MQFTIRTLLCVTAIAAVIFRFWPPYARVHGVFLALFAALVAALVASCCLVAAAWRILLRSAGESCAASEKRRGERIALAIGVLGMVPYTAALAVPMLDPYESGSRGVHEAMLILWHVADWGCLPAVLLAGISLVATWSWRWNRPLALLRLVGLAVNLLWPLVVVFAILPRL